MEMTSPHKTNETVENNIADGVNAGVADEPGVEPVGELMSDGALPGVGAPVLLEGDNAGVPGVVDGEDGIGGEEDGEELTGVSSSMQSPIFPLQNRKVGRPPSPRETCVATAMVASSGDDVEVATMAKAKVRTRRTNPSRIAIEDGD